MLAIVGASTTSRKSKTRIDPARINQRNRRTNDFGAGVPGPHEERLPPSPLFDSPPDMIPFYGGEIKNTPRLRQTGPGPRPFLATRPGTPKTPPIPPTPRGWLTAAPCAPRTPTP